MADIKEECGLFGIWDHEEASQIAYLGIFAQQHRGEESAGMATTDGERIRFHKDMGLVGDVFSSDVLDRLANPAAIAHTRYSTTGSSSVSNAQPLVVTGSKGRIALAHNGNLTNGALLREELEARGSLFATTNDSEVLLHLISDPEHKTFLDSLKAGLRRLRGAFSFLLLTPDCLVAVRDRNGFRPLAMGKLEDSWVFASETCAFDQVGADYVREVQPGEMIIVDGEGMRSDMFVSDSEITPRRCIFEHVYFSRPDSRVYGQTVHISRVKMGRQLAKEHPVPADVVIAVPDSGTSAALGYSQQSGIPLDQGFIRNHYVGRTFIQPHQSIREKGVGIKLNAVREVLQGKRVVVVDDSVIRGTTSLSRIRAVRRAGASEIHLRISCPPTKHACYYGVDFPNPKELIANSKSVKEIGEYLGVDSMGYLSLDGMVKCMDGAPETYCHACFSGDYAVPVEAPLDKYGMEK